MTKRWRADGDGEHKRPRHQTPDVRKSWAATRVVLQTVRWSEVMLKAFPKICTSQLFSSWEFSIFYLN